MEEGIRKKVRRDYVLTTLKENYRLDGRGLYDFREIEVRQNVIETAEGSAMARIGTTVVLAGVKFDIITPFPQEPDKGALITGAELLPLASKHFEPGPPDIKSIEFARVVDRGLRSAEVVDLKELFIEEGKALGIFVDLYVLNYGGNLFDAGSLAALAALLATKVPKVEDGEIIREEYVGKLNVRAKPLSTTFGKIADITFLDPALEEESVLDARLTITTDGEHVVSLQKGGVGSFKKDEVLDLINLSFKKREELLKHLGDGDA